MKRQQKEKEKSWGGERENRMKGKCEDDEEDGISSFFLFVPRVRTMQRKKNGWRPDSKAFLDPNARHKILSWEKYKNAKREYDYYGKKRRTIQVQQTNKKGN